MSAPDPHPCRSAPSARPARSGPAGSPTSAGADSRNNARANPRSRRSELQAPESSPTAPVSARTPSAGLLMALVFGSGVAGLGYQMTWVRLFSAGLGHEVPAVVGVIGAFLGGMALGAWRLDARIAASLQPARWLLRLELCIGAWGLASALLIPAVNGLALDLLGGGPASASGSTRHWLIAFGLPFLTLLPATVSMGATLPAMERLARPLARDGRALGAVYAANTAGAVAGTLGGTFILLPVFGLLGTLVALASVNGLVALALARFRSLNTSVPIPVAAAGDPGDPSASDGAEKRLGADAVVARGRNGLSPVPLRMLLFATGWLGLGFELAGLRGLAQVLENTAYTYAATLSVYLAGTAIGAALFHRVLRGRPARPTLGGLLLALSVAMLGAAWTFPATPGIYGAARDIFGDSILAVLAAEVTTAAAIFGPSTLLMGAVFSLLVQAGAGARGGIGRAAAWNTAGCATAAIVVTVVLLPGLGLRTTLLALGLGYAGLVALAAPRWRAGWAGLLVPLAMAAALPERLNLARLPEGAAIVAEREGAMATVQVVQTPDGHRSLRVNNRLQMGGTGSAVAQHRQAHLPLLLHPHPRSALFLGPGTGITLGAARQHPGLRAIGVELLPEVVELMPRFAPENSGPFPTPDGAIRVEVADARRFLRTDTNRHDVIVADLFHPAQDGAGFLYTREQFEAARRRLSDGGIFCQWLPLHQLDEATLRLIVRTFTGVFSESRAVLLHFNVDIPVLGLVGARGDFELDPGQLEERLANPELRSALRAAGLDRPLQVLGCLAAGPEALRDFGRDAPTATDHHPAVLFSAPRFAVRRDTRSHATLIRWLDAMESGRGGKVAEELLSAPILRRDTAFAGHLGEFMTARDEYLRGLVREVDGDLTGALDLYLASTAKSLYFTPSYARVTTVIQAMAMADREQARALWRRLEQARPDQPLGRRLLAPLIEERPAESAPPLNPRP